MRTEAIITIICVIGMITGCSQKIYDRTTTTIDPNGLVTIETVHYGSTAIATDTSLDNVSIESGERRIALNGATEDQDSIKATAIVGGVPVAVESKGE